MHRNIYLQYIFIFIFTISWSNTFSYSWHVTLNLRFVYMMHIFNETSAKIYVYIHIVCTYIERIEKKNWGVLFTLFVYKKKIVFFFPLFAHPIILFDFVTRLHRINSLLFFPLSLSITKRPIVKYKTNACWNKTRGQLS